MRDRLRRTTPGLNFSGWTSYWNMDGDLVEGDEPEIDELEEYDIVEGKEDVGR